MATKKATEDQFNELHNLVTKEFLARIKSGEASTQDLKAASVSYTHLTLPTKA